jgi:multidrug efflux pump subunit AcrA (membrane-fusion protein)
MKNFISFLFVTLIFYACGNKTKKENLKIENAKKAIAVNQIVGIGKIVPENDIIQVSSPVNGIVMKIDKKENDTVHIGDVLLQLDHQLEDEKITQMNKEVATQAAQIKVDAASVGEWTAKASNAKKELQSLQNLLMKGAETQQAVDDKATELKTIKANLNKLVATVNVSKRKWQETKTAMQSAVIERDQKIIKSRIDGKILEISVLIGSSVSIAQSIAQISPLGNTIAICEIDELNAEKIIVGQKGWIRNIGASDTLSTATVYSALSFLKKKSLFTDQSGEKEDRRVRTIKMMIDQPEKLLLNARVECVVDISSNLKK